MRELILIIFMAVIIYYVVQRVQHQSLVFRIKKEDRKDNLSPKANKSNVNLCKEGEDLYHKGDLNSSENIFLKVVKSDPQNPIPYHFLGMIYLRQKLYKGAIEALERAVILNPLDDIAFNNLGLAYLSTENFDKAIESFEKSVALNDKIAHRYVNLSIAYQKSGNLEKAALALENAIKIHKSVENLTLLAKCYLEMDAKKLALKTVEQLLELDPKNNWAKRQISTLKD